MCPEECFVFGGTLTAVGDMIYLFGGNSGNECLNRVFAYSICMKRNRIIYYFEILGIS
jgi:hypothetical protein